MPPSFDLTSSLMQDAVTKMVEVRPVGRQASMTGRPCLVDAAECPKSDSEGDTGAVLSGQAMPFGASVGGGEG